MNKVNKYFFSHILQIESVHAELEKTDMEAKDRVYLALILEETVHNAVVDDLLSQLSEEDKHSFLKHMHVSKHEDTWGFLKGKIDGVEKRVGKLVKELKKEFLEDLKK